MFEFLWAAAVAAFVVGWLTGDTAYMGASLLVCLVLMLV